MYSLMAKMGADAGRLVKGRARFANVLPIGAGVGRTQSETALRQGGDVEVFVERTKGADCRRG